MAFAAYDETFSWRASGEALVFRYQLDGEDPAGWTVVPSTVTSYTAEGLSGDHVFYVQQSPDGVIWSESCQIPSYDEDAEDEVYAYPREKTYMLSLLIGAGTVYNVADSSYAFDSFLAELSLGMENLRSYGAFGIDIRADIGVELWSGDNELSYYFSPPLNLLDFSAYSYSMYVDYQGGVNVSLRNLILYAAVGPRLQLNFGSYDTEGAYIDLNGGSIAYKWGVTADAGLRVGFSRQLSAGFEVSYTWLFDRTDRRYIDYRLLLAGSF